MAGREHPPLGIDIDPEGGNCQIIMSTPRWTAAALYNRLNIRDVALTICLAQLSTVHLNCRCDTLSAQPRLYRLELVPAWPQKRLRANYFYIYGRKVGLFDIEKSIVYTNSAGNYGGPCSRVCMRFFNKFFETCYDQFFSRV